MPGPDGRAPLPPDGGMGMLGRDGIGGGAPYCDDDPGIGGGAPMLGELMPIPPGGMGIPPGGAGRGRAPPGIPGIPD